VGLAEIAHRHPDVLHPLRGGKLQLGAHDPGIRTRTQQVQHGRDACRVQDEVGVELNDEVTRARIESAVHRRRVPQILLVPQDERLRRVPERGHLVEHRLRRRVVDKDELCAFGERLAQGLVERGKIAAAIENRHHDTEAHN
jgi:hypothetical protein